MTIEQWITLLVAAGIFALIPVLVTLFNLYGEHRRIDTMAHAASGASLASFSVALLPLPPLGHALLVTAIGFGWEFIEPRLEQWFGPLNTGPQDTEADIAVVGLSASLLVMVVS